MSTVMTPPRNHGRSQTGAIRVIKKFPGGSEATLRARITLSAPSGPALRKELGPISLAFEIPNHNVSGLNVRYLRIAETHKNYQPRRWVRYVVTSNSYTCRT